MRHRADIATGISSIATVRERQALMPNALVLLFACGSGLSVANVYYAQPLLDTLAREFAISHAAVGGVITATQFGSALALLLLVPLGDLVSRRGLMLAQSLVLALALLCVSLATSTIALMAGMLAVGLLGTAMTQGLIAYAATSAAPPERGRVVGAAQGGVVIGLLLARVLAGMIADAAGWRWVYGLSAASMVAMSGLFQMMLPKQAPPPQPLSYAQLILSMFTLLRHERVLQIRGMIALLMFAAFGIFWSAMVFPLSEPPYNFSRTVIGAFGLVGVIGVLAAARAGYWADRGMGQRTTGGALLLLLAAWLPLAFTSASFWAMVAGILILDLAVQAIQVTNQGMIFQIRPEAHSRLVGCYMMFYAAGSGIGAIAATTVYAAAGWNGVCLLGAAVSFIALVFWAGTLPRMKSRFAAH